jgi:sulfur-oxidizing protein SoxX
MKTSLFVFLLILTVIGASALEKPKSLDADTWQRAIMSVEKSFSNTFGPRLSPPEFLTYLELDETQATCSKYNNFPPPAEFVKIMQRERATIKYPEGGIRLGDWKNGEKLSLSGYGRRVGDTRPGEPNGGNCYACHALSPDEYGAGNLGPSLTGFGKMRGNTEATRKYLYEKIYNSNAYVPCSGMPRFGYHGVLTEEQIFDVIAFLLDPESPVNK